MCTKKSKLLFNALRKGRTGSAVCRCLKGVLAFIIMILFFALIFMYAYLLARYTPFYIVTVTKDHKLASCDGDILNVGACIVRSLLHSFILTPVALTIIASLINRPENCGKILFLTMVITATIMLFVHNFISITRLIMPSVAKACVYNETTSSYDYECYEAVSGSLEILIGGSLVLVMFFTLLAIPVYEWWRRCRQHIKEDLETFDVEAAKVDN